MSQLPNNTCGNRLSSATFIAATGTRGKILADHSPGGVALPDSTVAEPQTTRGGQRIIAGSISSTEPSTARDIIIYRGSTLTEYDVSATGALAVATTSTITRGAGDFRADGWCVGDALMPFGAGPSKTAAFGARGTPDFSSAPAALASAGVLALITAVSGTTLTFNGTPLTVESLAGCRLVRVAQAQRMTIPAAAGNAAATPSIPVIGGANDADINALLAADRGISLGEKDVLIGAMVAAVAALPVRIDVNVLSVVY